MRYLTPLMLFVLCASQAMAVEKSVINGVAIYRQPPQAYELAKILFPPKTRSITLNQEPNTPPNTQAASAAAPVTAVGFMINFEYNSVHVLPKSRPYLDSLGEMLNFKQLKDKPLMIEGHADATGDEHYNLKLSEARAQAIKDYLVSVHRIEAKRLLTQGQGENRLLDPAHPAADINRRAEFKPWGDEVIVSQ